MTATTASRAATAKKAKSASTKKSAAAKSGASKSAGTKSAAATPVPAVKTVAAATPRAKAMKLPKPPAPAKAVSAAKDKPKKPKLVRDSFTMPEAEYAALGEVKKACLKAGVDVKKSQLLRVGVALVRQLDTGKLKDILAALPALKAGRPKKSK